MGVNSMTTEFQPSVGSSSLTKVFAPCPDQAADELLLPQVRRQPVTSDEKKTNPLHKQLYQKQRCQVLPTLYTGDNLKGIKLPEVRALCQGWRRVTTQLSYTEP